MKNRVGRSTGRTKRGLFVTAAAGAALLSIAAAATGSTKGRSAGFVAGHRVDNPAVHHDVSPPLRTNTVWSGFGGGCQSNDDGDATVEYDRLADRWIISQFSVSTTPFLQCVAVSTSGDPTGSYYRYSFQYANFPDYPKLGVWPDAYYTTFNMFNSSGTQFIGPQVCAFDRAKMLQGQA